MSSNHLTVPILESHSGQQLGAGSTDQTSPAGFEDTHTTTTSTGSALLRPPRPVSTPNMDPISTKNMSAPLSPTSVSSTTSSRKFRRDTGFPEPFCGSRNTTLPHPEADLSPGASISAADIDSERSIQRSHRSILRRTKHKGTLKYGKITEDDPFRQGSASSSSLAGHGRESGDDATAPAALEEISVIMLPNGKISTDGGVLSFEEERSQMGEDDEDEEHKKKRHLFRRILGRSR